MNPPSLNASVPLTLDRLRRIQATLEKRGQLRDGENIRSVGFAPRRTTRPADAPQSSLPITAQFDVRRKLKRVAQEKRIEHIESVRLLDRHANRYQELSLFTDVSTIGDIVATGVRISTDREHATTSVVVRWTKIHPSPPPPGQDDVEDPRWRWGVLSVSHLFVGAQGGSYDRARVRRRATCGQGPNSIHGRVVARGRIPGGPDISLLETGLDRLWLSGFLVRPDADPIPHAAERRLLDWVSAGTDGSLFAEGVAHSWRWQAFYPELYIEQLGRLRHMIRYECTTSDLVDLPFGPGSSGGVLIAGGIPIGLQVAATRPGYRVGYAQAFHASLPWLQARLQASAFQLVRILVD